MRMIYLILSLCFVVLSACSTTKNSQADVQKEMLVRKMIESKRFTFRANTALPSGAASRQLTSEYDLKVTSDTITSYLPYFGRSYSVPVDLNDGGIKFTSTQFNYATEEQRNGGWNIIITPRDANDVRQMVLNISATGFASLQVLSRDRQTISFNGNVIPGK